MFYLALVAVVLFIAGFVALLMNAQYRSRLAFAVGVGCWVVAGVCVFQAYMIYYHSIPK